MPVGRVAFESRAAESLFYAVLMFSPILCAGLLFGSAIKHSTSLARDYGTNLLGAMVGGVAEYLSLVTGFRFLLPGRGGVLYRARVLTRRQAAGTRALQLAAGAELEYKIGRFGSSTRLVQLTCDKKGHDDG